MLPRAALDKYILGINILKDMVRLEFSLKSLGLKKKKEEKSLL